MTGPFRPEADWAKGDCPSLREQVLAGRFIGAANREHAEALEAFLSAAPEQALHIWCGDAAAGLGADPQALRDRLDRDIAAIDRMLGRQLDAVLHHERLRRMEGSWRGLHWLVQHAPLGSRVRVRVLQLPWSELCRDLGRAGDFDQSQLWRKVYEDEFGTLGGEPFGLLLVDHGVQHRTSPGAIIDDVTALGLLAQIACAAFAPTLLGVSPALLELDGFEDIARLTDAGLALRGPEHQRWRASAARPEMRFIGAALPRVLGRPPWPDNGRADGFRYAEYAPTAADRVWTQPVYAFGLCAARAFAAYGWPADVRGSEQDALSGGLFTDVPSEPLSTDPPGTWPRPPVEVALADLHERQLTDAGLMPLSTLPFGEALVFGAMRSRHAPARHQGATAAAADANAQLSSQFNAMLCASRFAHVLKVLGRRMVGSHRSADDIERELQRWLSSYVDGNVRAGPDTRARYPLSDARIEVHDMPSQPGHFGCTIWLQPHHQLDDVSTQFRLTTELSGAGKDKAA